MELDARRLLKSSMVIWVLPSARPVGMTRQVRAPRWQSCQSEWFVERWRGGVLLVHAKRYKGPGSSAREYAGGHTSDSARRRVH